MRSYMKPSPVSQLSSAQPIPIPSKLRAKQALKRAVDFARSTQDPQGYWEDFTDPRIFDTAIVSICLVAIATPDTKSDGTRTIVGEALGRARKWLDGATPQRHDAFATAVDEWLRSLAMGAVHTPPPDVPQDLCTYSSRALLIEILAVCVGSPGADPTRLQQAVAASGPRAGLKQWQRALLAAAEIVSHARLGTAVPARAIEALKQEQRADGAFCLMPAITALACVAFNSVTGDSDVAGRRCLDYLLQSQHPDGTWRYLSFDIWDTTLMVRSLRGVPAFDAHLLEPALGFVERTQSADGGWACKVGLESDNDTTGAALLALAETPQGRRVLPAAARYLQRVQRNDDGLWTTWQSADDTPSPDVTAHVVAAVTAHPTAAIETSRAVAWLVSQHQSPGGWNAEWYPTAAYAVAEIAAAVGWTHEVSRRAAGDLVKQQRADGGWLVSSRDPCSAPAATGLALSALVRSGIEIPSSVFQNAVNFLVDTQTPQGTWQGVPIMAGPRPFLNHCPRQTHAFVCAGLRDFVGLDSSGQGKQFQGTGL
ncbi:prenyltransferase/squalene oxidase repeat-containing protein [Streptomyces sp. NPDC048663]|uniref:prenyltransferase/squalene oxidase repeat-containing protein n=1 Tax=Streptomyces sp. NPDC048663 TaxID=3155638 RepID=UPI0034248653